MIISTKICSIKITHVFATLLEAVEISGIDISYNPAAAIQEAKDTDRPNRYFEVEQVFLCDDGEIRFVTKCHDGLKVLNTFDPFISVLSDQPFTLVTIEGDEIRVHSGLTFDKKHRAALAKLEGVMVI